MKYCPLGKEMSLAIRMKKFRRFVAVTFNRMRVSAISKRPSDCLINKIQNLSYRLQPSGSSVRPRRLGTQLARPNTADASLFTTLDTVEGKSKTMGGMIEPFQYGIPFVRSKSKMSRSRCRYSQVGVGIGVTKNSSSSQP